MTDIFFHDPGATFDYTFDWSDFLTAGETLSASSWTVSAGMSTSGPTFGADSATVFVTGGTAGTLYTLTNQISTSGGRSTSRFAYIFSMIVPAGAGQVTLDEAKAALNYGSAQVDDDELEGWLRAAEQLCELESGEAIRPRVATDTFDAPPFWDEAPRSIYLRQPPVIAIISMTRTVDPLAVYGSTDLILDSESGRIRLASGLAFTLPWGGYSVSYIAGRAEVPQRTRKAILITLDHLWMTQRGWQSAAPNLRGELPAGGQPLPAGFALPNRARELLTRRIVVG